MRSILLFLVFTTIGYSENEFKSHCESELAKGRSVLHKHVNNLALEEASRIRTVFQSILEELSEKGLMGEGEAASTGATQPTATTSKCPAPNNTMFTTAPPTTQPLPTTQNGGMSTTAANNEEIDVDKEGQISDQEEPVFRPITLYSTREEEDPFATHMQNIYNYVASPSEVCNGPAFTDINSISEHQLYGFLATIATSQPGPFCTICHRMMDHVRIKLFSPSKLPLSETEKALTKLLYSQVPSTRSICSAIAPGCYDNYEEKVRNITQSVVCLECSACMSVTNVLQHRILLKPSGRQALLSFLQSSLFHNICAELCTAFEVAQTYPSFTYQGCQDWFTQSFDGAIKFLTVLTRPERLCTLELGWCELNETPNMLHCLKELCDEYLRDTPQTRWLCSQIPDSPAQADEFLNIKQSKIYKQKKAYHHEMEQKSREEL